MSTRSVNRTILLSRQSQDFQKPLLIFPHLTRANHRQITQKKLSHSAHKSSMETFLNSHSRFIQDHGCKPAAEKERWSPRLPNNF